MKRFATTFSVLTAVAMLLFCNGAVAADSAEQSASAWKKWKSIQAAVALKALDGPEDILEKAEIIGDRIDMLKKEQTKLERGVKEGRQKIKTLENQREVLKELAEIRQGGDVQTQQRLHKITEQVQQENHLMSVRETSLRDLKKELDRLKRLLSSYRNKAHDLRTKERNVQ